MSRLHTTNLGSLVSVNGVQVPKGCSTLSITYQDTSDSDSGRSGLTGSMWKGYIGTLRTLKCVWNSLYPDHIREILQAVKGLNKFPVQFYDPESGEYVTSDFYVGDRSTDIKTFYRNHELIGLSLTLIENDPYADGNGDTGGGGGITPTGTIRLTYNGEHDVTEYATADVQVPPYGEGEVNITSNGRHSVSGKATAIVNVPSDGITPTGTVTLSANGKHDVTNYAEADVQVPPYGEGEIEINNNGRVNVSGKATAVVNVPQGVTPTGTVEINSNGKHNVSDYAEANVQVPPYGEGDVAITSNGEHDVSGKAKAIVNVPTSGITPSGTLDIAANGNYDVTQYAQAHVQVDSGGGGGDDPSDYDAAAVYAATRPADWLPMPTPEAGEMYILMLIPDGGSGYIAMQPTTNSGQYTVTLGTVVGGDFAPAGEPEAVNSNTAWEATLQSYDWGDPTADGYRQCMIRVAGDLSKWQPTSHSALYSTSTYAYAIVEIACNLPGCSAIKVANISQLRYFAWYGTNSASTMARMFEGCGALIAILALDTSNATSVDRMCYYCYSLRAIPALDLGKHDDRQSVNANNMLQYCSSLTGIPEMDMSAVSEIAYGFESCFALRRLPQLNLTKCANVSYMARNCVALTEIVGINMPAATIATYMCSACTSLQTVGDIVSPACTNMSYMFDGCSALRSVSSLDASSCTKFEYTFQECYALETLPVIAPTVSCSGRAMCYECYSLRSADNVDFSHFSSLRDAFRECHALQRMPDMHLDLCTDVQYIFNNCFSLIAVERMRMAKVSSVTSMFAACRALASLKLDPDVEGWSGAAIAIPQASLSHDAVVALIDSLPTITSARTLSITSSPAAGTLTEDELAVAAAKNWTVTVT